MPQRPATPAATASDCTVITESVTELSLHDGQAGVQS